MVNYDLAALYSVWGRELESLAALQRALSIEPAKVRGWLRTDPKFQPLRGQPGFDALAQGG
jgi:hypothetical protein